MIVLLNVLFLLFTIWHCVARAQFHDYQFLERDNYGRWALADRFAPGTPIAYEVKQANRKWHFWLWTMIVCIFISWMAIVVAVSIGQTLGSAFATVILGIAMYTVLVDPFISLIALEKDWLYISESDAKRIRKLRLLKKIEPGLLSLLLRIGLLAAAIIIRVII